MIESKSGSGVRPSRAARSAFTRAGQPRILAVLTGSGAQLMSALASGPATRSRAAAISPALTVRAGMVTGVESPQVRSGDWAARSRAVTALAGEATATRVSGGTGQVARWPASGSLMMPETQPDAARFGRPGRTVTVISRRARPRR